MYIPPETLDLIRSKVVIEDVIKRYVPSLKKRGKNYTGLCPFHKEKTPSFSVSPDKQIFYCFGCHTGGNIFNFISKIERLEFPESVKFVADMVGVEIGHENRAEADALEIRHRLNRGAMELYHAHIKSPAGKKGLSYITARGVTPASINDFKIGYAPDAWDFLIRGLIKSQQDREHAEQMGLVKPSQKRANSYYDVFRNRVMFPIFDLNGNVVGFGGRTIGDDPRKYLNSSESTVFKKRNILYGLNRARDSIKELDRAIVVEGYLDVIGCHQAGITNVVAPLGTAITTDQIKLLGHYCTEIIFLFDADSAGLKAAARSLDLSEETNLNIRIGMLPQGDPFDYIIAKGPREFMVVVDTSMRPTDFRMARILENKNLGRAGILMQIFGVIRDLKLETERSDYIKKASMLLEVDENSMRADFRNYLKNQQPVLVINEQPAAGDQADPATRGYRDLIRLICNYPELMKKAAIDFTVSEIPDQLSRNILQKMSDFYQENRDFTIDKIFDFFNQGPEMDFLNQAVNGEFSVENPSAAYTEIYLKMKVYAIDDKINKYDALLKSSPGVNSNIYLTEIDVLRREKEKLLHFVYNKVS